MITLLPNGFVDTKGRPVQREFYVEAGRGTITGASSATMFGFSPNSPNAAPYNVWELQVPYTVPATAQTLQVVSDSASDTAAGTGARTVLVIAIDANYNQVTQVLTMNGTTPVSVPGGPFMTANTFLCLTAGSNGINVGNITLATSGSGAAAVNPQAYIAAGRGASHHGHFTIPAGFTYLPSNFFLICNKSGGATGTVTLTFWFVPAGGAKFQGLPVTVQNGGPITITVPATVPITEKMTIYEEVSAVSVAGFDVSFGCTGTLIANTD